MNRGLQIMVEMERAVEVQAEAVRDGNLELYLGALERQVNLLVAMAVLYQEDLQNGSGN